MPSEFSPPANTPATAPLVTPAGPTPPLPDASARTEWLLLHLGFVAVGIITTLIGNVLPTFIHRWSLTDAQGGFLIAAQFSGSSLGTALTSVLLPRFGFSRVLFAGFVAFALGFSFLGLGSWQISALAVFTYGFGYGLVNPATNLLGTQLPSRNVASAVSFLNFSWTIGAVSCPFVVGRLLPLIGVRGIALSIAAISLILAAFHFFHRNEIADRATERATHPWSEWKRALALAPSISLMLLFFLYVGSETGIGNWIATQEKRLPGNANVILLLAPSFFYGFLLFGRGISPLLLRRFSTGFIALCGLISAAIGTALIIFAHEPHLLFIGAAFVGFGCAPQYPILVTWVGEIFGINSNWLGALFFGISGVGGAALPWLMGITASQTNSLRIGFVIPFIACITMALLIQRARPKST